MCWQFFSKLIVVLEIFLDSDLLFIENQGLLFIKSESHRYILEGLTCDKLGSYKV